MDSTMKRRALTSEIMDSRNPACNFRIRNITGLDPEGPTEWLGGVLGIRPGHIAQPVPVALIGFRFPVRDERGYTGQPELIFFN